MNRIGRNRSCALHARECGQIARSGRADANSIENLAQRGGGTVEREIADVEVTRAGINHRAKRSRADVNGRGAGVEFTGETLSGNWQELPQRGERSWVRAPVEKDPEDSRLLDTSVPRLADEALDRFDIQVADNLGEVVLRVEAAVADERDLLRRVCVGIGPAAERQSR